MLRVSEREIARAVAAFDRAGIRAGGSGRRAPAAVAGLEGVDGAVVLLVTGRNIDGALPTRVATHRRRSPPENGSRCLASDR